MKIKLNEFLIITALFGFLVVVTLLTSVGNSENEPWYTAVSTHENGMSLLYDTLKHMGYPVSISTGRLSTDAGLNDVYLITQPDEAYLNDEELSDILSWVFRGGRLIYLETESPTSMEWMLEGMAGMSNGGFTLYRLGMGELLTGSCDNLLNKNLMADHQTGMMIQSFLDGWRTENVYFAEYYHGFQNQEQGDDNLWRHLPGGFKILLFQLLIVIALVLWQLGKRFGRPVPYYEEIERAENEYLITLSGVYQNAGLGSLILRFHYEHFIRQSAEYFKVSPSIAAQDIETLWLEHGMPHARLLTDTLSMLDNEPVNIKKADGRRQLLRVVGNIQTLCRCIKMYGTKR